MRTLRQGFLVACQEVLLEEVLVPAVGRRADRVLSYE